MPHVTHKNDAVIYPQIAYTHQSGNTLAYVTVLDEMWEVHCDQHVRVKWGKEWSRLHCEVQMTVQDLRYDQNGLVLWIHGEFAIMGVGTSPDDNILRHETLLVPFTSMILRPAASAPKEQPVSPAPLPPAPGEKWAQTGDWQAEWLANPLGHKATTKQEYDGLIRVHGRVWWFRKMLFPYPSSTPLAQI